jgi:hypothetical protein
MFLGKKEKEEKRRSQVRKDFVVYIWNLIQFWRVLEPAFNLTNHILMKLCYSNHNVVSEFTCLEILVSLIPKSFLVESSSKDQSTPKIRKLLTVQEPKVTSSKSLTSKWKYFSRSHKRKDAKILNETSARLVILAAFYEFIDGLPSDKKEQYSLGMGDKNAIIKYTIQIILDDFMAGVPPRG